MAVEYDDKGKVLKIINEKFGTYIDFYIYLHLNI